MQYQQMNSNQAFINQPEFLPRPARYAFHGYMHSNHHHILPPPIAPKYHRHSFADVMSMKLSPNANNAATHSLHDQSSLSQSSTIISNMPSTYNHSARQSTPTTVVSTPTVSDASNRAQFAPYHHSHHYNPDHKVFWPQTSTHVGDNFLVPDIGADFTMPPLESNNETNTFTEELFADDDSVFGSKIQIPFEDEMEMNVNHILGLTDANNGFSDSNPFNHMESVGNMSMSN